MTTTSPVTLKDLRTEAQEVEAHASELAEATARRDRAIVLAVSQGTALTAVAEATGISRTRVGQIVARSS